MAVIFDFDQTIAIIETYVVPGDATTAINRVFGGAARMLVVTQLLDELRELGLQLFIVSRNARKVVIQALKVVPRLFRLFPSGTVFGREDLIPFGVGPKSTLMRMILERSCVSADRCLFVDDNLDNIRDVESILGCACIHWPGGGGIRQREMDRIKEWAVQHGNLTSSSHTNSVSESASCEEK